MKNWKIGLRIGAGFSAVILVTLALGIFAFSKVGGIDTRSTEVTTRVIPKVYLVGQIERNVPTAFSLAMLHAATPEKGEKAEGKGKKSE